MSQVNNEEDLIKEIQNLTKKINEYTDGLAGKEVANAGVVVDAGAGADAEVKDANAGAGADAEVKDANAGAGVNAGVEAE